MSLIHSYDFTNIRIEDFFMGYLFAKGLDFVIKKFRLSLKRGDIKNNWNWTRIIFFHGLVFVVLCTIEQFFEKVKLKPVAKLFSDLNRKNFKSGFKFLAKEYPDLMYPIYKELEKINLAFKIEKITGVKANLDSEDSS